MRLLLAILGGLSLSVITFIAGLVISVGYFSAEAEKHHLTSNEILWTDHPVRVDKAENRLERVPGNAAAKDLPASAIDSQMQSVLDHTTTGSISSDVQPAPEGPQLSDAHLNWCASRYRSYRPRDNSYTPYSGGRRECVSPFTADAPTASPGDDAVSPPPASVDSFAEEESEDETQQPVETAMAGGTFNGINEEHAASCSARYRSYRAEDNTYQPYGGGARRQCE